MHTLVYVSGLGDDDTTWHPLWEEPSLNDVGHTAYVVPGSSGRPWNGEHIEDVASDLRTHLAELSKPVVLVGHSLGGAIGTILSESPPNNLHGFINVEGNLKPEDCGIVSRGAAQAVDFPQWFEALVGQMFPRYARALKRADPRAFRTMAEDLVRLSDGLGERYVALDTPKLVIYGTNGYGASTQAWIQASGIDAVGVDGAGHWVQDDAPAETAAAIRAFLDRNSL